MKPTSVLSTLLTAVLLPATTHATWCQFYYDSNCTEDANNINFDCNNMNVFGSGGGYVKCHSGPHDDNLDCIVDRCGDQMCEANPESSAVAPANKTCTPTGGPGPWYMLSEWYNEGAT
ncbi:hypothetical protein PG993_015151 [Apiospora rasikravindrae]|uniref:Uncharacterized protein n=1 Tax=Apiospora rasikravindrae TaxID=990691 RepID=A0ABR1RQ24_9PEZI